jgi:DNA-binding transcriptional LysR family regulator
MLDHRWLEGFITIAEVGSFTRAAGMQHVSVSGLSRRIRSLENWAGAELLDRSAERATLTPAGALLLPTAKELTGSASFTRRAIARLVEEEARELTIAAPHIMTTVFFSWWLGAISQRLGQPRISIISANLPECMTMLCRGEVDMVACLNDPQNVILNRVVEIGTLNSFDRLEVGKERLLPVRTAGCALESINRLDYEPECTLGWAVEAHLARGERSLGAFTKASLADGLRSMVAAGMGYAWLPERMVANQLSSGALVEMDKEVIPLQFELIRRASHGMGLIAEVWKEHSAENVEQSLSLMRI